MQIKVTIKNWKTVLLVIAFKLSIDKIVIAKFLSYNKKHQILEWLSWAECFSHNGVAYTENLNWCKYKREKGKKSLKYSTKNGAQF